MSSFLRKNRASVVGIFVHLVWVCCCLLGFFEKGLMWPRLTLNWGLCTWGLLWTCSCLLSTGHTRCVTQCSTVILDYWTSVLEQNYPSLRESKSPTKLLLTQMDSPAAMGFHWNPKAEGIKYGQSLSSQNDLFLFYECCAYMYGYAPLARLVLREARRRRRSSWN